MGEARSETGAERREVRGILREQVERAADVGLERLGGLVEEWVGRCLAARYAHALIELHEHHALFGPDRARDRERHREMNVQRADAELHRSRAAARRSAPAASRTGSAVGSAVSAAACSMARPTASSPIPPVFY